jgi:hypothetical protein
MFSSNEGNHMKVQVMAFPRSGTTLTCRTFRRHKDMEAMFFEKILLLPKRNRTKKDLIRKYPVFAPGRNCGEKNIYGKAHFGKTPMRPTDLTPIQYCRKWNKFFGKEARLVQIVRHPYDVWNSMILKLFIRRGWEAGIIKRMKSYFDFFPKYVNEMQKFPNCLSIKYEQFILHPDKTLKTLYSFCNLDTSNIQYEPMKISKVFWYKTKGFEVDTNKKVMKYRDAFFSVVNENIGDTLKVLNKIQGPNYEV